MIRLIAAIDQKRGIARDGVQPWKLPRDEQYFLDQTSRYGATVLMGQRTYEVIGHPLRGRTNLIASQQPDYKQPGCQTISDLKDFLAQRQQDLWVIGGALVFEQSLGFADELYLTEIMADFDCDKFFPTFSQDFRLVSRSPEQTENNLRYTFAVYTKS